MKTFPRISQCGPTPLGIMTLVLCLIVALIGAFPMGALGQSSTTEPPYPDNRTFPSTTFSAGLRQGNVSDESSNAGNVGIPNGGVYQYSIQDPATADVDYFRTGVLSGTTSTAITLLNNAMPDSYSTQNGTYTYTIPRNISASMEGATTGTLSITGLDAQRKAQSETLTWTVGQSGAKYTTKTFSFVSGATVSTDTSTTVTMGFGNTFGLNYPVYSNQGIVGVLWDADGADFPNTPLTVGGIAPYANTAVSNVVNPVLHRVWNALATNLPGTASTDDLGLVTTGTTLGTDWAGYIQTADMDNNDAEVPYYSAFFYTLPPGYVTGDAVTIVANAGMVTTVADVSCTLDFQVYEIGTPATDICATAATTINSLTAANVTFTITPTALAAGDTIIVRANITGRDNTATGVTIGRINKLSVTSVQSATGTGASSPLWAFTPGDPTNSSADRYGTFLLGATNVAASAGAPDGTADYAIWVVPNDYRGVADINGIWQYDTD